MAVASDIIGITNWQSFLTLSLHLQTMASRTIKANIGAIVPMYLTF